MAAPSCYITTQLRNLENELPADAEQNPPRLAALGCDMADFLIAAAPRPAPRGAGFLRRDLAV